MDFSLPNPAAYDPGLWWFHDDSEGVPFMTFVDGRLVFTAPEGYIDIDASLGSKTYFPLGGASSSIEVVEVPDVSNLGLYLDIGDAYSQYLSWRLEGRSLYAEYDGASSVKLGSDSSSTLILEEIPYDPVQTRWLRVRETGGQIVWETSPDNADWTQHASMSSPPEFDNWVFVGLEVWNGNASPQETSMVIDNLNGGASDMGFCAAESLQDDFEDGIRALQWNTWEDGPCEFVESGRLGFSFSDGGAECAYVSGTVFDLSQSSVTVEGPLEDVPLLEHEMMVFLENGDSLEFELWDGVLLGERHYGESYDTVFMTPFDPVQHKYWRVRGAGTSVFWELSSDGREWQEMATYNEFGLRLDRVRIALSAYADVGSISSADLGFDNLNIGP